MVKTVWGFPRQDFLFSFKDQVYVMLIHPKIACKCFFSSIVTTALMASSVLRFPPIEQAVYHLSGRRFHKLIPQMHSGTDKSMSRGTSSHLTSPVGSRPLSCGPGQCWCWSPRIHRDRFHPPETEMKEIMPLLRWDTNRTRWSDSGD